MVRCLSDPGAYPGATMYSALIFTRVVLNQGRLLRVTTVNNQDSARAQADLDLDSLNSSLALFVCWYEPYISLLQQRLFQ